MEVDLDLLLENLNATATDDRKNGINKFLDAIKNYYHFDNNESYSKNIRQLFSNEVKLLELFAIIGRLLRDPDWKIRKDTFEILITIITKDILKEKIDFYISSIIKYLINCLSDSMLTVRKIATQCLHEYLNKSFDFAKCMHEFVKHGLHKNLDFHQRQDNHQALQVVLTSNFAANDFTELINGILKQLELVSSPDSRLDSVIIGVLRSIKKLVGDDRFLGFISNLPLASLVHYSRVSQSVEWTAPPSAAASPRPEPNDPKKPLTNTYFPAKKLPSLSTGVSSTESVLLGFLPQSVLEDLQSERKLEAIEEISNRFPAGLQRDRARVLASLADLFELIRAALMDSKYLVLMTAFRCLIDIAALVPAADIDRHLDTLVHLLRLALERNMDGDAIIHKYTMAFSMVLFEKADTGRLVEQLCDARFMMEPRQAFIRQKSIDIVIGALLQLPSTKFDLDFLSGKVAQRLLDKKHKVKQAALECISVIGYNYGNGKISSLLKTIELVTKSDSSGNIADLVQARLSKHRLPHVDDHGNVIYAVDNDKSARDRQHSFVDFDNSSSDNSPISSANPLEKRRPSAGKIRGRARFPWDQNEGNCSTPKSIPLSKVPGINSKNQIFPSDTIPISYSPGILSITSKELSGEGRTTRKGNEQQSNNNPETERNFMKNQSVLVKSFSTESQFSNSSPTAGYSSYAAIFRNHCENSPNLAKGNSTATNSTSVTPRNKSNFAEDSGNEKSPIPTKPALGRSAGTHRKESDVNYNDTNAIKNDKDTNQVLSPIENQNERINSPLLQGVRNSASKKKALKIFKSSISSSGINIADLEINFNNSQNVPSNNVKLLQENTNSQKNIDNQNIYYPYKGATFKPNPQYSSLIIGKGVSGPPSIEPNDIQPLRKKPYMKGMLETSSGNATQRSMIISNSNGSTNTEPKKYLRSEFQQNHNANNYPDATLNAKNTARSSIIGQPVQDFNNEIIGIRLTDKSVVEDYSDEEPNKGIMSNTLRESLSLKRQKVTNEIFSFKPEQINMTPTPPASYSAPGSGSHQMAHRKPPAGGYYYNNNLPASAGNEREITNGYETVPLSRKPLRPALGNSTPKKIKPASQILSNPQFNSGTDPMIINAAPLNNPEKSINECINLIQNEDWEKKISAMSIMQSLVQFHSEILTMRSPDIHAICIALCKECKNLRSQVAKSAIQTVSQLFTNLRKHMDLELDNIVSNLLSKAGEGTNSFLKQDVETALLEMIENVSPQRAFIALLQSGSDHKNVAIRRLAACNIMLLCNKLGSTKTMLCIKEMPDKILPGIIKFSMDGNQETRYYGKKILYELSEHQDFEKLCNKHIQHKDLRILKDILENIKIKGIGDPPQFSHSAGLQRSGSLSRGASAGNLDALGATKSLLPSRESSRSMTRLPGSELSEDDIDWLANTCSQLSSSDFRNRQLGLESLLKKSESNGLGIPSKGISKLLKELIPRLNDNNTKVTVLALNVCQKIIPLICSIFPTEFLPEFINTIALNFASKSVELRDAASILMNVCFTYFDPSMLIQPCIEAINKSNPRTKPILIENMNDLLLIISSSKTASLNKSVGMIIRHLIPQIGLLIDKNRPLPLNLKESVHNLVVLTHEIVGQEMIDAAAQRGDQSLKQALIDILSAKTAIS